MSAGDNRIPPGPADGDAADAWLRAALRHAPDSAVSAPADVTAAILRQAAAATVGATAGEARRPARPSTWQSLMAAWSWLARPPVTAGFASVMLAGVIGLMWWDKPLNEALPARAPEASVLPLPPVARAQVESETTSKGTADSSSNVMLKRATAPAAAAATATATANANAATPAPAAVATPSTERSRVAPDAALGKARPAPLTPLTPTPTPVSEPARRESSEALADAAPSLAQAPAPPVSLASPTPMAAGAAGPAAIADALPKLSARSREARLSAPPTPLLTELRAAIRAEPQRWTWQRGAGAEQTMTAGLRTWLDRLGDGSAADNMSSASAPATELRLLRDGQLHTTLMLGAASLRLTPADARRAPQQTALSPEAAAELKATLDTAAP